MRKIILLNLMVIGLVGALVAGASTFAYFSDTGLSSASSFTAGTLNLQLGDGDEVFADGVTGTWTSPASWAPGDTVTATIYLRSTGTVPIQVVYMDWKNGVCDGPNMLEKIKVVSYIESSTVLVAGHSANVTGNVVDSYASVYDHTYGASGSYLSLWELINGDAWWPGTSSPWESISAADDTSFAAFSSGPPLLTNGGPVYGLQMGFQFDPLAGNEYQGVNCTFDLNVKAMQVGPGVMLP